MQSPITSDKLAALEQRMAALGIAEADLLEKFVRGSGSGGQKINKTSNCVFLKHLPTGVCIKCQMDRSREMNRFLARRELCDQLDAIREGRAVAKTQAIEKMRRTNRPRSRNSKTLRRRQTKSFAEEVDAETAVLRLNTHCLVIV